VIIFDTCVFSLVFRRHPRSGADEQIVNSIRQMILDDWPIVILGIVYQELLSGIKAEKQLRELQSVVDAFPIVLATKEHHRHAAIINNACRKKGIAAGAIDCLIAAISIIEKGKLFTLDNDFQHISKVAPISFLQL